MIADAAWLDQRIAEIEEKARVVIEKRLTHDWDQLSYPPDGVRLARGVAEELGLPQQEMMTVAGHDSPLSRTWCRA